jgi:hypothetical protein
VRRWFQKLLTICRGHKLGDGKTPAEAGHLQNYNGNAIRSNSNKLEKMKQAVFPAVL